MRGYYDIVGFPVTEELRSFTVNVSGETFTFTANIEPDKIETVVACWLCKTDEITVDSLVSYINSKKTFGFRAEKL